MITLISPYPDLSAFGIRSISSYLKRHGFRTRIIFLPDPEFEMATSSGEAYSYPPYVLTSVTELCRGSDLIGISFITYLFDRAVQLTEHLKATLDVPVLWGGKHVSIKPEEGLQYADMVCVGEGEEAVLELAVKIRDGEDLRDIRNIWLHDGQDTVVRNQVRPLDRNIDFYGMPDYDTEEHFIWDKTAGAIMPFSSSLAERFFEKEVHSGNGRMYLTMTSRGCPFSCSYCFTFKGLYPGQAYLRHRSVGSIIAELADIKKKFGWVRVIGIADDCFLSRSIEDIREFSRQYKEQIGLPLTCLVHPSTVTEEKIACLVDAGLCVVQMGIEAASEKTKALYNRNISNDKVLEAARVLNKFRERLFPLYDFIIDNVYETDDDVRDNLMFVLDLPRPYRLQLFSLVFFPGTRLYEKAKQDGHIEADDRTNYRKLYAFFQERYYNFVFILFNHPLPQPVMRFLISNTAKSLFDHRPFTWLAGMALKSRRKRKLRQMKAS